jgi:5'-nucleotidase
LRILLTNDDGIYAPGLRAIYQELGRLGSVEVSAPKLDQSGVGHSITYLHPLMVQEAFVDGRHFGWEVAGSPADCVKLAMLELCPQKPDLVVSGINSGANLGINVLYSGTVAAAIEGAFFGVTSIAVSLAMNANPDYARTAKLAVGLIEQILAEKPPAGSLLNLNFPESRPGWPLGVKILPMGLERYREVMEKRADPRGRTYYWSGTDAQLGHPAEVDTDVEGVAEGYSVLTPLQFNLTDRAQMERYCRQAWALPGSA